MHAPTHFHLFSSSSTLFYPYPIVFSFSTSFGTRIHFPYRLQHYALRLHGFTRRPPSPPHCSTFLASSRVIQNHGTPCEVVLCRCPCHSLFLTGLMMMAPHCETKRVVKSNLKGCKVLKLTESGVFQDSGIYHLFHCKRNSTN